MRKKRDLETDEQRTKRAARHARERIETASAEDRALDAAVRRSIHQHGP
jgi:hypothetical protein